MTVPRASRGPDPSSYVRRVSSSELIGQHWQLVRFKDQPQPLPSWWSTWTGISTLASCPTALERSFCTLPSPTNQDRNSFSTNAVGLPPASNPFVKSAPRRSGRTCWANNLHTLRRFWRLPGICFGGFGCRQWSASAVFAVVSACNLRVLRRFWRLLKSLQTAKKVGCPPSMAVLAVLTVSVFATFECFTGFGGFGGLGGCRFLSLSFLLFISITWRVHPQTLPQPPPVGTTMVFLSLKESCRNGDPICWRGSQWPWSPPPPYPARLSALSAKICHGRKHGVKGGRCCAWRSTSIEVGDYRC